MTEMTTEEIDIERMSGDPAALQQTVRELKSTFQGISNVLGLIHDALIFSGEVKTLDEMEFEEIDIAKMSASPELMKDVLADVMQDLGGVTKVLGLVRDAIGVPGSSEGRAAAEIPEGEMKRVRGGSPRKPNHLDGCYY